MGNDFTDLPTKPRFSWGDLGSWLARPGLRQGAILFAASALTNVLDYGYNVLMGRLLSVAEYGTLVSLSAVLQVVSVSVVVISTVVARYAAEFMAKGRLDEAGPFCWTALRRTAFWGLVAVVLFGALSKPIAGVLRIPTIVPVLVAAVTQVPLLVKPVIWGMLQGFQKFIGLGVLQLTQATLRLVLGVVLVNWGLSASGAMAALPASVTVAMLVGLALLWRVIGRPTGERLRISRSDLTRYAGKTTIGLISYAVLVNMHTLVVKHYFGPIEAGTYSMAITLGKIVLFVPGAFAVVLFPMSAERHLQRRDSSRLLRLSLAATLLFCAALAVAYLAVPDLLLGFIYGVENPFVGPVLGLVAVSMGGYALVNVWLNYYLSVEKFGYAYVLLASVGLQFLLLVLFHASLAQVATVMTLTSLGLVAIAGAWSHFSARAG